MSASYSSPGNFSGYRYSLTALGSSDRQKAWAVLVVEKWENTEKVSEGIGDKGEWKKLRKNK